MYTATKLGEALDRQKQRLIVTVRFTEGEHTFDKDFPFALTATLDEIKRVIKNFLDQINTAPVTPADGALDLSGVADPVPTAAELAKQEWFRDFARLERVAKLIELGVLMGNETPVVNLRDKVRTNFKPAYVADM